MGTDFYVADATAASSAAVVVHYKARRHNSGTRNGGR